MQPKIRCSGMRSLARRAFMLALMVFLSAAGMQAAHEELIVTAIEFTPTQYLTAEEMLAVMTETKVGEPYDEGKLTADLYAIYALAQERYGRPVFYDIQGELIAHEGGVKIVIHPIELSAVDLPSYEITGFVIDIDAVDEAVFRKHLDLEPGTVRLDDLFAAIETALQNTNEETGYFFYLPVDPYLDEEGRVNLTVRAARLGSVAVEGNQKTRDYVIEREIESKVGEPFNLETFYADWWRINRLGFFSAVEPDITEEWRDDQVLVNLVWRVQERQTGSAGIGAGYSTNNGFSGYLELADENLFGRGQSAAIKWEFGGKLSSYDLSFYDPNIAGSRFSGGLGIHNTILRDRKSKDGLYDADSIGGYLSFGRRFTDMLQASLRLGIKDSELTYKEIDKEDIERVRSLRLTLFGDSTDSLFYPTRGLRYSTSTELARPIWKGTEDFTKYEGQISTYHKVGSNDQVVALRLMGGFAVDTLPDTEKFHVGGADTVRGYGYSHMIGDKMLVGNVEYRFKISDAVHGVVFVDTGAAWDAADKWDLNDLQSAFGLGVRFDTPLGMMRLDYGIGSEGGKFNFSIGPTF